MVDMKQLVVAKGRFKTFEAIQEAKPVGRGRTSSEYSSGPYTYQHNYPDQADS